jgi:hypothetical protein
MEKLLILASLALGVASLSAPVGARNYDCSKAGNANKTACKSPGAATVAASKSTKTVATTKVTTTATARNYDCTKAGNKNKAACKTETGPAAPARTAEKSTTTQATMSASYDCTKFYNKMRAVCRAQGVTKTTVKTPTVLPVATNRPIVARSTTTTVTRSVNSDSVGATAQCKDSSFSHAQHRSGACSRHGGVAKWL